MIPPPCKKWLDLHHSISEARRRKLPTLRQCGKDIIAKNKPTDWATSKLAFLRCFLVDFAEKIE